MVKESSSDFEHLEWVCWADNEKMNLPDRISPFHDLSKDVCTKVERDAFALQLTLAWLRASSGSLTRQSKWCAVEHPTPPTPAFPWEAFLLVSVRGRLWSNCQGVTHTRLGLFRGPIYDKTAKPTRRWFLAYMKQPAGRFFSDYERNICSL